MELVHIVLVTKADVSKVSGSGRFIFEHAGIPTMKVFADAKGASEYAAKCVSDVVSAPEFKEREPSVSTSNSIAEGKPGLVSSVTVYPSGYLGGYLRVVHSIELVWRDPPKFGPGESERMRARAGGG